MDKVFLAIGALACPLGMGAMMWWMAKGMRRQPESAPVEPGAGIDGLREEHRRLGAQIEQLEQDASVVDGEAARSPR